MAQGIQVEVDGKVIAEYERLPNKLRAQLRHDLPEITREVKAAVAAKLTPGALFKTTNRLLPALSSEMVETTKNEIYGRVYIDGRKFPSVIANTLESGSRPHPIKAKFAPALVFFFEKLGHWVRIAPPRFVNHPGFPGRSYMKSTFDEKKDHITDRLKQSVAKAFEE